MIEILIRVNTKPAADRDMRRLQLWHRFVLNCNHRDGGMLDHRRRRAYAAGHIAGGRSRSTFTLPTDHLSYHVLVSTRPQQRWQLLLEAGSCLGQLYSVLRTLRAP